MIGYQPVKVLFSIGSVEIHSSGLAFFLAFFVGFLSGIKEVRRRKLDADVFKRIFSFVVIGSIIGARLFYVLENLDHFYAHPIDIFRLWTGGASSYGGFIGGFLLPYIYVKRIKLNIWGYGDAIVPGFCIAIVIKRIGCFLNWDDYGIESALPWAVNAGDFPRHPTQIYLALNGLILFFVFMLLRKRVKNSGTLFLLFVMSYSVLRFPIEFLREGERYFPGLTMAQISGLVIFLAAFFYFFKRQEVAFSKGINQKR